MFFKNKTTIYIFLYLTCISVQAHDTLLEIKGAFFLPTDQVFKNIYNNCGEFGVEVTSAISENIYGFASFDFISKLGNTPIFHTPTNLHTINFGIGLKYFIPWKSVDFYLGIGAEPTYLRTLNESIYIPAQDGRWGCGGIAKLGAIIDLPHAFFFDIFIDYSFIHIDFKAPMSSPVKSTRAILDGTLFGIGFGYRFN